MPEYAAKLSAVSDAAEAVAVSETDLEGAREKLRAALRAAHQAGAPYSLLGDLAGLSRQRVAQLVAEE
jgi:sugar/nucleoside kinase (ribokinase family)